jgi:hypothetical protein
VHRERIDDIIQLSLLLLGKRRFSCVLLHTRRFCGAWNGNDDARLVGVGVGSDPRKCELGRGDTLLGCDRFQLLDQVEVLGEVLHTVNYTIL